MRKQLDDIITSKLKKRYPNRGVFKDMKKKLLIALMVLFVLAFMVACGDQSEVIDDQPDTTTTEETAKETTEESTPKEEIVLKDGYNKLQSLYLQIDDSYTRDRIKAVAKDNSLKVQEKNNTTSYTIFIANTNPTGQTDGFESSPTYNSDYIRISVFKDEEKNDSEYYALSKTYYVESTEKEVEYTFYNSELLVNGEAGDWSSVEEALSDALN